MKYEKYDQIVGQVQARGRLPSREAAVTALRAVLGTLATRIRHEDAHHVASQLPREIGIFLEGSDGGVERFDVHEWIKRVGQVEGEQLPAATYHTRVVMEVIRESISPGALGRLRDALPADYQPLLDGSSRGQLHLP